MDILKKSMDLYDYTIGLRRHLHENPELSGREFNTVKLICAELDKMGIEYVNIPGGGVLAHIDGNTEGKTVLLRADCDALPIDELPNNAKKPKACPISKVRGVHHACGHDGHTAMLLTAAKILNENKDEIKGRIYILFERGEEGGGNIYWIMKYIQENNIHIDASFAEHTDTDLSAGQIACQGGPANAGNVGYKITITGKGGHGSRPDKSINPIDCFVSIYECIKTIRMNYVKPDVVLTNSMGMVHAGEVGNVIPHTLQFKGTCRFYDVAAGNIFKEKLIAICKAQAELFECEVTFDSVSGPGLPVINNHKLAEIGADAVRKSIGDDAIKHKELNMGSESYAYFTTYYPAVMMRVGIRNDEEGITVGAHNPGHDIDENGLPYGTAAYIAAALGFLNYDGEVAFDGDEELRKKSIDELRTYTNASIPPQLDKDNM